MSTLPDCCHNKSILFSILVVTAVATNSPCAADVASCTFDEPVEATSWVGESTAGWDSPWIVPHPAVSASIEQDRPLRPGSGPSLRLAFSPSTQKIATSVWRAPGLKNGIHQVLSFDFRLESSLGANDVSIHDARYPKAISENNSAFVIRICGNKRGTVAAGHWAFYDGDRSAATIDWNRFVDSGMKCEAGKTYTCRVTLDPKDRTWKVRLSDGERTVEREGLGFRCADTEMPRYVGFGAELPGNKQKKPDGEPLVFRIDNVHYEGEAPEFAPPEVVKMPATSAHGHFITRRGDQLFDGDKPYRFFGANMPGLVLPYDYWFWLDDRMVLPTPWEIEDALKTARRMNLGCLRTWNLPMRQAGQPRAAFMHVLGPRQFNEAAFVHMDYLLALANKHGCRLMIPLTADAGGYLGGINTYANYRGRSAADFYSDPQLREDYKATLKHVLTRVNTVTGVPYREDKAILAWQFGNELDRTRVPEEIQTAWQAEMAAYVKQLAPNQLLAYG
ncbi:MAG: hypothetical protein GX621_17330, partial [Pirellulaceae bacterium]|nr:hypothetical protein [Pirellulaceae bacterium]